MSEAILRELDTSEEEEEEEEEEEAMEEEPAASKNWLSVPGDENAPPHSGSGRRERATKGGWACKRATALAAGDADPFPLATKAASPNPLGGSPSLVLRRKLSVGQDQLERDGALKVVAKVVSDPNILPVIMRHLPKSTLAAAALVNRRWVTASRHHSLWARVNLTNKTIALPHLHSVLDRQPRVLRLYRADIPERMEEDASASFLLPLSLSREESREGGDEEDSDTSVLSQKTLVGWVPPDGHSVLVHRLKYLDLSMAIYSGPPVILSILRRCRALRCLSLELGSVSDAVCAQIGLNPELEQLNLTMASGLTANGIKDILDGCRELRQLNLAWTGLSREAVSHLCSNLPSSLIALNIAGGKGATLLDEDCTALVQCCPRLEELDVSDASHLSAKALGTMMGTLKRLQSLHISRCYLPDHDEMARLCSRLHNLNVFGVYGSEAVAQLQTKLRGCRVNSESGHFSTIARPTTGIRRSSIWLQPVRDD